jgi:hypothetical protein
MWVGYKITIGTANSALHMERQCRGLLPRFARNPERFAAAAGSLTLRQAGPQRGELCTGSSSSSPAREDPIVFVGDEADICTQYSKRRGDKAQ